MNNYQTPERMALKEKAIPLPDLAGKSVLDVGCDHGHWCWLASDLGAGRVLGLDRNRDGTDLIVRNIEEAKRRRLSDVCDFAFTNLGKQWREFGKFDVVFCFSMYHHVYENCGDHLAIWYWLWRHTKEELLWENPTGADDDVVRLNVSRHDTYNRAAILKAAEVYFTVEEIGPALHVKTREVWRCKPRKMAHVHWRGKLTSGGGGATKAFNYADGRRIDEIMNVLGTMMFPGSLNARLDYAFGWDRDYYRAQILDVVERPGLDGEWKPRWARFYPVTVNGIDVHALRFEGEAYGGAYIEFIAPERLRDKIEGEEIDVRS